MQAASARTHRLEEPLTPCAYSRSNDYILGAFQLRSVVVGGLLKRSMRIAGHRTSVALEAEFWEALEILARTRSTSLPRLIAEIDRERERSGGKASLASAVRVFVLTRPAENARRN